MSPPLMLKHTRATMMLAPFTPPATPPPSPPPLTSRTTKSSEDAKPVTAQQWTEQHLTQQELLFAQKEAELHADTEACK